jgi:hypothetical protein
MIKEYVPDARAGDRITICVDVCDKIWACLLPILIEPERVKGKFAPEIVMLWPPFGFF